MGTSYWLARVVRFPRWACATCYWAAARVRLRDMITSERPALSMVDHVGAWRMPRPLRLVGVVVAASVAAAALAGLGLAVGHRVTTVVLASLGGSARARPRTPAGRSGAHL
jgi:hypothetical protein